MFTVNLLAFCLAVPASCGETQQGGTLTGMPPSGLSSLWDKVSRSRHRRTQKRPHSILLCAAASLCACVKLSAARRFFLLPSCGREVIILSKQQSRYGKFSSSGEFSPICNGLKTNRYCHCRRNDVAYHCHTVATKHE